MAQERKKVPDKLKYEAAAEVGFVDYANMDKANLTARENGKVGGQITKRLVELGKKQLS